MDNDLNVNQVTEGAGNGANNNPTANFSFTEAPQPDGTPAGDALPLDGSLSPNGTEPLEQRGLHPDEDRVLLGSEAGQTAQAAIDAQDETDRAVDAKGNFGNFGQRGDDATSSEEDMTQALDYVKSAERPGQTAAGGQ